MRRHRFYIPDVPIAQAKTTVVQDSRCLYQWRMVLRFRPGQQVSLFDGAGNEALYEIRKLDKTSAILRFIERQTTLMPPKETYLFWSLLKKDNNEWVLQKATELGVTHFVPMVADRCETSDVTRNRSDRWHKIIIEAAEQCGRSDIPQAVLEPLTLTETLQRYGKDVAIQVAEQVPQTASPVLSADKKPAGSLIGPEGGWSDEEKQLFLAHRIPVVQFGRFVLRAETAAVVAAARMVQ